MMNKISLAQRRKITKRAIEEGQHLVLYIIENTEATQFRYRVYNVMKATCDSKK